MTLEITVLILALCLLFEAFFSGAELALISADKVRLRTLAESVPARRRRMIERFLDEPGELISAALAGTNLCVVLSTVTATMSLLPRFPRQAELISLALMTPLVLVFGEIVPKSIFQHFADRVAPRLIYILSAFRIAFFPFVFIGSKLSTGLLKLLKLERRAEMTRDELKLLIKLPSRPGADGITAEERKMVSRVFDFREMAVEDVMVPLSEVTAVPLQASVADVAAEIDEKRHTRLPVYNERIDQIEGIVHAFDVLRAPRDAELSSVMRPPVFVPESQPAIDTLVLLQREAQHMAVIVDEYGGAVGVTTIDDLLEEIVGEIRDEFDDDDDEQLITREADGAWRVQGRAEVERVNEVTRLALPESDDYESVAGLVLDQLKRIPSEGAKLELDGLRLTVTKATERSVDEVRIERRRTRRASLEL
ncbi:MAG: HlyC/CorC family transporter [Myxococcales bacterium]|nr:HlyC/CorC family transporter [Myxococcales bacterium]